MANRQYDNEFYDNAARSAVSATIVSKKGNVCPFTVRLAWHASGTFDTKDKSPQCGGSNGATMRFPDEIDDDANAGLSLMHDILKPLKKKFPDLSTADLWTMASTQAVALTGGPTIPFNYGRTDDVDGTNCPPLGRLPDASQGAAHLRDVFYRMSFGDKEIVALSGAHTLGSCHRARSGFDGPWTTNPLKFDNEYFKNLLNIKWKPRKWDGPLQYTDPSGKLMMLPTDMALIEDKKFLRYVKAYANDEKMFFKNFAEAFGKLLALGCPAHVQPGAKPKAAVSTESPTDKEFRDLAMHGSLERMKEIGAQANPDAQEAGSGRTSLHKAAYFGHVAVIRYLVIELGATVDLQDTDGDTALHEAARFGHVDCVTTLLAAGASRTIQNADGKTALDLAAANEKEEVVALLGLNANNGEKEDDCVGCVIL